MSDALTQKLLVTMTCVFGVVVVLIGYGKQHRNQRYERYPLKSTPTISEHSTEPTPNQDQQIADRDDFPNANQPSAQWQSMPEAAQRASNANIVAAINLQARDSFYNKRGSTENFFNPSAASEPDLSWHAPARHPSAQRIAERNQSLQQRAYQQIPQPVSQPILQTRSEPQFHDYGNIRQAVATQPISKRNSNFAQTVVESRIPERDLFTVKNPSFNDAAPPNLASSQTNAAPRGWSENQFAGAKKIEQPKISNPKPELISSTNQNDIVARIPAPEIAAAPPVQIDRGVRKANWNEIEATAPVDPSTNFRPLEQPVLPKRHANPQVEARVRQQIQYGQSLARRRAYFAAREEFIRALLLIASSYNQESNSTAHPERLAQGLIAIDELGDFERASGSLLQQKILSHKSQLLTPQDLAATSPIQAMGVYSNFAENQIQQAIGFSVAGSEALHALGKLESMVPEADRNQIKKLILYRAAISIDPSNVVCANDLGVLLFEMGRLEEAQKAMIAAIGLKQSKLGWNNLTRVHRRRAAIAKSDQERERQLSLANLAAKQAAKFASQSGTQPSNNRLDRDQWATPNEFQDNAAFPNVVVQHADRRDAENTSKPSTSKSAGLKQKLKDWF